MNKAQKKIVLAMIFIIVGMIVFPPFQVVLGSRGESNMGYGFIINPPKLGGMRANVNAAMLLIQWTGVLVVGGLAFYFFKTDQSLTQDGSPPIKGSTTTSKAKADEILRRLNRNPPDVPVTTCKNCGQKFEIIASTSRVFPICPKCLNKSV